MSSPSNLAQVGNYGIRTLDNNNVTQYQFGLSKEQASVEISQLEKSDKYKSVELIDFKAVSSPSANNSSAEVSPKLETKGKEKLQQLQQSLDKQDDDKSVAKPKGFSMDVVDDEKKMPIQHQKGLQGANIQKHIDIGAWSNLNQDGHTMEELKKKGKGDFKVFELQSKDLGCKKMTILHPTRVEKENPEALSKALAQLQTGAPTLDNKFNTEFLKSVGWDGDKTIRENPKEMHFNTIKDSLDPANFIDHKNKTVHANVMEGLYLASKHYDKNTYESIEAAVKNYMKDGTESKTLTNFLKTSVYKEGAHPYSEDEFKWAAKNALELKKLHPELLKDVGREKLAEALLSKYMARTVMTQNAPGLVSQNMSKEGQSLVKFNELKGVDMMVTVGAPCNARGVHQDTDKLLLTTRAISTTSQKDAETATTIMKDSIKTGQEKQLAKIYQASEKGFTFGVMKFPIAIPSDTELGDKKFDFWKAQEDKLANSNLAVKSYKESVNLTSEPGPIGTRSSGSQRVLNYGMEQRFQIKGGGMTTAPHGWENMTGMEMDEGYHDTDAQWTNQWGKELFGRTLSEQTSASSTVGSYELTGIRSDADCLRIGTVTCRESDSKGLRASIFFETAGSVDDGKSADKPKGRNAMLAAIKATNKERPQGEAWREVYNTLKSNHKDEIAAEKDIAQKMVKSDDDKDIAKKTANLCLETYAQLRFFGMKFDDTNTGSGEDFSLDGKVSDTGGLSKLKGENYLPMMQSGTVIGIAEQADITFEKALDNASKEVAANLDKLGHKDEAKVLHKMDMKQREALLKDWAVNHQGGRDVYQAKGIEGWAAAFSNVISEHAK